MEVFVSEFGLYTAYTLFAITTLAAIVMPFVKAFQEPKQLLRAGIGLVGLLVIFLISGILSGDEVTAMYTTKGVGIGLSKLIGGMLIMMYLLISITIGSILYTEITKMFK